VDTLGLGKRFSQLIFWNVWGPAKHLQAIALHNAISSVMRKSTQRDGLAILRSLIHQLFMRRRLLIKYVKAAYDLQGPQFYQTLDGLWRIFVAIASDKRVGPISVIVDAIDECEESTRERLLQGVIKFISKPRSPGSNTPCIKFLVTSRPSLGRRYTENLLQIDSSHNHIGQDLRLVIQTKIEGIVQRTQCTPSTRAYLENALYSRADGTFLWVTLVLHLLEKSFLASQQDFKRIIDELPIDLTATYERFLHTIPTHYQQLATRILHFLVGSSRPLTLDEMRILFAIQGNHRTLTAVEEDAQPNIQETIEGVLGPLVRIYDSRIYLVHQSLKEFLQALSVETEHPLSAMYGIDSRKANLLIAEACVSYLLLDDFRVDIFAQDEASIEHSPTSPVADSAEVESIGQLWDMFDLKDDILFKDPSIFEAEACVSIGNQYPFFEYSARHWAEHYLSASLMSQPKLEKAVLSLSDTTITQGLNWLRFYWLHTETSSLCPRDFVPIVTASYFGHVTSLNALLREGFPCDSDKGTRAIYWASRMGHREIVDLLLQEKVNPDIKIIDNQCAFIIAVQHNRLEIVKRLLEDDKYISNEEGFRVNRAATGGRSALSIAAGNGFVEVVKHLLQQSQIEPDKPDSNLWTPLFWSVSAKNLEILKLLVADRRVSVNHVDSCGRNVLSWAASAGELELVRYLISLEDLKAHETDLNGRTALSWAAGNGHLETTTCLRRSRRIDVSRKDKDGRNALSWACSGAHYKVVKYLLKHDREGADDRDVDGWTPLAWALFTRAPKTVQVLLDSGIVDVNKKDRSGRSALSFAASYGYLDIVQLLLNTKGIEIDSKDIDGQTPLAYAMRYPEVAKVLRNKYV
jgi:ankyrin repeat domain-containing protein 50